MFFSDRDFAPSDSLSVETLRVEPTSTNDREENDAGKFSSEDNSHDDRPARNSTNFKKAVNELSPLPRASDAPGNPGRRGRTQKAELITSSPYKRQLEQSRNQQKKVKLMNDDLGMVSQEEMVHLDEGDSSWFCILCGKEKEEDMIQCMDCRSWVHTRCAKVKASIKKYLCKDCK